MNAVEVAVALIHRKDRIFLQRRPLEARAFPGRWELPGGKLEASEDPKEALRRELQEELAWAPVSVRVLPVFVHDYGDRCVRLHPFHCDGPGSLDPAGAWGWFRRDEALRLPLPDATHVILEGLEYPLK